MKRLRRGAAAVAIAVTGALAGATIGATRTAADLAPAPAGRVVVLSVPGLTWEDVAQPELSTLRALLRDAAVANLAVRVERLNTLPGDAYATVGAGTRAFGPATAAGLNLQRDESWGSGTAAEEFVRRTGDRPRGAVVVLGRPAIERANDAGLFGGVPGRLGDALAAAGVGRGVVANSDISDPRLGAPEMRREAALALAGSDGTVPCGRVDDRLLARDPAMAYGVRLDTGAVMRAFDACATPRSVVLVEASDLRRAQASRADGSAVGDSNMQSRAWRATDRLVAALTARLDLRRDALVVVAPSGPSTPHLTVFGVRAPGLRPGLLVSGSTRQAGYVTLADVTPTIAQLAGVELALADIEGRPVEWARRGGGAGDRLGGLVNADRAAIFRDSMVNTMFTLYVVAVSLLGLAATYALVRRRPLGRAFEYASLCVLAVLPVTYLAAPLPFYSWGKAAYLLAVLAGALALGGLYVTLRGSWLNPLVAAYGVAFGVVTVSVVLLGSRLQVSSVFGDSPIIAGRFSGINNVTFAQFMVAAVALATIAAHRLTGRARAVSVVAILAAAFVIDAAPPWGADVGGALSGVAGLAFVAMLLNGWRVRARTVAYWVVGTLAVVALFGLLDLTRDPAQRTHLGRLFERVGADGWSGLRTVVERKLDSNLRTLTSSVWRWILVPVLVGVVAVVWKAPAPLRSLSRRFPELERMLPGLLLLAALGYALNDSGIATPGMMLAVVLPAASYLLFRVDAAGQREPPQPAEGHDLVAAAGG